MLTKTNRAPLALGLATLMVAMLVPVSGADADAPLYTFELGGPGEPKWTMLKLNVTRPGAIPYAYYEAPQYRCPMTWGTFFLTGTPDAAETYNSLSVDFHSGRTGAEVGFDAVFVAGRRPIVMMDDGVEHCLWMNVTVEYQELPVGTVYMLQYVSGVPFDGRSTFWVDGSGVTVEGVSSGTRTFYVNETEFAGTLGVIALAPPWCGVPWEVPCSADHLNQGGGIGASAELDRRAALRFRHHPFWSFSQAADVSVSNASVLYPDGTVQYETSRFASPGGQNVIGGTMELLETGAPPGVYEYRVHNAVGAGRWGPPGWWVTGADIQFPEEQAR